MKRGGREEDERMYRTNVCGALVRNLVRHHLQDLLALARAHVTKRGADGRGAKPLEYKNY